MNTKTGFIYNFILIFLLFITMSPVMGLDMAPGDEWQEFSEPEILLESLEDILMQLIAAHDQNPEKMAVDLKEKIFMNPRVKYHLLSAKEKKLWEDIWFNLEIYNDYQLIFAQFEEFARSRTLQLALLKQEPLDYPAGEIIAHYLRNKIAKIGNRLKVVDEQIIEKGGEEGLDIPQIFGRFMKRVQKDNRFFQKKLDAVYAAKYAPADHPLLAEKIKNLITKNIPFFFYLAEGDKEILLSTIFYYCVYKSFDYALPEVLAPDNENMKYKLIRYNLITSPEHRLLIYNYFIRRSAVSDLHEDIMITNGILALLDDNYYYTMLLGFNEQKMLGIKFYLNYNINLAFDSHTILQDNPVNAFSLGLYYTIGNIIPGYPDFTLLLSSYISYDAYNYESVFNNDLYAYAAAVFHSASVNGGLGISFLEFNKDRSLRIRPLCFQFIAGYIFFNRIDTRDYGNILLEDALQLIFKGKYFLDIEIEKSLDILLELNYNRYSSPVDVDANIPLFQLGPGISFLFRIY